MNNIITQEEKDRIDALCKQYDIVDYIINPDGTVDVVGCVDLENRGLTSIPLKFNKVGTRFSIHGNRITSLLGAPREVGTYIDCESNQLTSLEHCPTKVSYLYCGSNNISSLCYCPTEILIDILYDDDKMPIQFNKEYQNLHDSDKRLFIRYQHYYDVWTPEFNLENMQLLLDDIKDGLR